MDEQYIAERITELRIKKGVSEYQMSLDLGKNKGYIQSITSKRALPSMHHFFEICDYFEITPEQFFKTNVHNIPLYRKAIDLFEQLDDDDMLAVISILSRLADKHK